MIATFWSQGYGQLGAAIVAIVSLAAFKPQILSDPAGNADSLDYVWRLIIGCGAVPGAVALYFRLTYVHRNPGCCLLRLTPFVLPGCPKVRATRSTSSATSSKLRPTSTRSSRLVTTSRTRPRSSQLTPPSTSPRRPGRTSAPTSASGSTARSFSARPTRGSLSTSPSTASASTRPSSSRQSVSGV